MKTLVKVLIVLGFGASLAGCVVAPYGRPRAYVVAPAPVVVVHPVRVYWVSYGGGCGRSDPAALFQSPIEMPNRV